jgi:hypothetical protein
MGMALKQVDPKNSTAANTLSALGYQMAKEQSRYDADTAAYLAHHGIFGAPTNRHERRKAAKLLRGRK